MRSWTAGWDPRHPSPVYNQQGGARTRLHVGKIILCAASEIQGPATRSWKGPFRQGFTSNDLRGNVITLVELTDSGSWQACKAVQGDCTSPLLLAAKDLKEVQVPKQSKASSKPFDR